MDHVLAPVHDDVALPQGGDGFDFAYDDLLDYQAPGGQVRQPVVDDDIENHWEAQEDPAQWADEMVFEDIRPKPNLPIPEKPSQDVVDVHEPFAPWCECCVERSSGPRHMQRPAIERPERIRGRLHLLFS